MVYVGVFPEIDPETTEKLASETKKLWTAAHEDGSDNRVNGDAVLEASSYDLTFGFLAAGFMWVRKLFRNRGKTREDLKAEKEAAGINRTCGALEQMLLEYFRSAQEGAVDGEALDELIDNPSATPADRTSRVIQMACKHAVKGGERLPEESVKQLIRDVIDQKVTPTCPHGRPLMVQITRMELEKRFRRIQG